MGRLTLPIWAWATLIVFLYVAVKAPNDALGLVASAGKIVGAVGDGVVKILTSFHMKL